MVVNGIPFAMVVHCLLLLSLFPPHCAPSSSVDYFSLIEDYTRNVKGFRSITLLSCPRQFKLTRFKFTEPLPTDYFFRFVDISTRSDFNLIRLLDDTNCHNLLALDTGCDDFAQVIEELSHRGQFNTLCRAFYLFNSKEEEDGQELWFANELQPLLSRLDFTFVSNVVYGTRYSILNEQEQQQSSVQVADANSTQLGDNHWEYHFIYDIWNPGRSQGGTLKTDLIGVYQIDTTKSPAGLQFIPWDTLPVAAMQRRLNLSELHLECAIVVTSPFNDTLESYITHNYNPYLDTVHRLNFRTIGLVQEYFKFKLHVRRSHSWGYVQNASSATTFDGMVGMVRRPRNKKKTLNKIL